MCSRKQEGNGSQHGANLAENGQKGRWNGTVEKVISSLYCVHRHSPRLIRPQRAASSCLVKSSSLSGGLRSYQPQICLRGPMKVEPRSRKLRRVTSMPSSAARGALKEANHGVKTATRPFGCRPKNNGGGGGGGCKHGWFPVFL